MAYIKSAVGTVIVKWRSRTVGDGRTRRPSAGDLLISVAFPYLLYGADRASSKQASGLTFQSGRRRLGRRYFVTVARPGHKNLAFGAKRLIQSNLQQILRLSPRAV